MSNCIKSKRKLVKGQHPLKHFIFYLDIENYIASKQIEEKIIELGGRTAFFFAETVTHIITDKTENKNKDNSNLLNSSLITPVECIKSNDSKIKSRADEMLQRVRIAAGQQQQEKNELLNKDLSKNNLLLNSVLSLNKLPAPSTSTSDNYINKSHIKDSRIWDSKHAINILNKLINEKEKHKLNLNPKQNILNLTKHSTNLKECYIKIESFEKFYRPYYKNFEKWPKINLKIKKRKLLFNYQDTTVITNNNNSSIINPLNNNLNDNNKTIDDILNIKVVKRPTSTITNCLNNSANKILNNTTNNLIEIEKGQLLNNYNFKQNINKTTTSGSDEDNLKKKCGFCELCKIEYDNLNKHLISDTHTKFSENSQNYLELDTLIKDNGLNLENFLKINNIFESNLNLNNSNNLDTTSTAATTTKETSTNNENNDIFIEGTIIKSNTNNNHLNEKQNIDLIATNRKKFIESSNTNCGSIANRTRNSIEKKNLILNEIEIPLLLPGISSHLENQNSPSKNCAQNSVNYSKKKTEQILFENQSSSIRKNYNNLKVLLSDKEKNIEKNNFLLRAATINYKINNITMTKCNGINKNLTKRLKADEILIDRHYFRETRQSMCKKNLYSITLPSAKATKTPIKNSRCNNSIKKSTVTTRKSSPSKKSYYEADEEEDDDDNDQDEDDDDDDIDFINKNVTAPANVFHNNLRSQHKPNNCSRPKRNSMSMYYKVINNKNSPKKDCTATIVNNVVDSKPVIKKFSLSDSRNAKTIDKPLTIKIKKIRQTELSVLNGEAENFMFPKRLEQRKRSGEDSSSDDNEQAKKKIKNCQTSKFNNLPNSNNFNNSINKNKSIIQFCSNEKILEKVNKTNLRGDIDKYRFAFEKVPRDELWYNVFRRQDTSNEHVYEYYGNTAYRKLPYEMGPLPALECKDKCLTCRLMENNLFKNESPNQIVLKDKIDIKKEILDNQHQEQQVDDEKISNNSIENEINKSTRNDITTTSSRSNNKQLLKRDSSKSLLESYDIPRKSPREHASTLAILSCLLNSKNSSSGSENEHGMSQNINQTSTKLINSDEPVILNYKRRPKKTLKLSKSLLENRINSTLTNSSNLDEQRYSPIEQKKITNLKSNDQSSNNNFVKQPGRPMHWKQRPKTYINQNVMDNGTKYENPVKLNLKIDKFLESSSSVFPDDDLDILNNTATSLFNPIRDNEIVSFSNDLNLIDLMDETLLKQQKIHFNKLNTNVVKKRKNNNKTGWPKKKKILTRQQKRKSSSQCENEIKNCNQRIIFTNSNIKSEILSVDTISSGGEDNVDDKISTHETDDDDTTTLKNDEYLSAESNLDDNEVNSIPSTEEDLMNCCKYCGLSSNICDEQCNNVIANNKSVRASPIKQEPPTKQSPIKISPRKLRKPRGRWYRER